LNDPQPSPIAGLDAWLNDCRADIDTTLARLLERHQAAEPQLGAALAHALLLGGKRMRPALAVATCEALAPGRMPARRAALAAGAAVELVHAYSLVHDDLPAMDDDDLRRGHPTVHVRYGEATAILAGDGLLTLAFEVLGADPDLAALPAETRLEMVRGLAAAAGIAGMVGGQALDMAATGHGDLADEAALAAMHRRKTGALIRAAIDLGALASGVATEAAREALARYGAALGLAFQVVDDVLDATGDTTTLGKTAGADAAAEKTTYIALLGVDGARSRAAELCCEAESALATLPDPGRLGAFVAWVRDRRH
jgi:geranylgeranyl pyrophosphate synthase